MKVLVLTPYLPHRRVGHGGGTAVRDLVTWLAKRHEVQVAALVRPGEKDLIGEVEELGASVAPLDYPDNRTSGPDRLAMLFSRTEAGFRSLRSGYPWYVEKYWSGKLSSQVLTLADRFAPDAVQVEYLQLALLGRDLSLWRDRRATPTPRLVLNTHELGSVPRQRRAARAKNPLAALAARREAKAWRHLQVDATGWFDRTLCVTPEDEALYRDMGGRNLVTVPLGMDLDNILADWSPGPDRRFLFVGSFNHRPNRLAADFLLDSMWPTVGPSFPGSRLVLAGRGSREFLHRRGDADSWAAKGVDALGFVDDLTPLFRDCHLFVAPLAEGGGIKIKILEAMARGIPVVTTSVGAEGITSSQDDAIIIAPCNQDFTAAVLTAANDPDGAGIRAARARQIMEDRFSWASITEKLTAIYKGD